MAERYLAEQWQYSCCLVLNRIIFPIYDYLTNKKILSSLVVLWHAFIRRTLFFSYSVAASIRIRYEN